MSAAHRPVAGEPVGDRPRMAPPHALPDRRWSRVQQLLADVLTSDDEVGLASVVASATLDLLDATSVSVGRFDSERGALQVLVNAGERGAREELHPVDESYPMTQRPSVGEMAHTHRSWTVVTGDDGAAEEQATLIELGKQSAMACPVVLGDRMWGELYVSRREQVRFSTEEVEVAETVASVLALSLHRLAGTEELRRLAYADALTGLGNRRRADELVEQALDVGRAVVVALFDVDGMKQVNDRDGHAAGDRLLRSMSVLLAEAAAAFPEGHAVRLGGDEFALVVLDADAAAVEAVVQGVVTAASDVVSASGLSAGVASSQDLVGLTPAARAVFRLADAALYRAKRAGGQRLTTRRVTHDRRRPPDQRARREPAPSSQAALADPVARWKLEALSTLAQQTATDLNAAAWWVSMAPAATDVLAEVAGGIHRDPQDLPSPDLYPVRTYYLEDYPATARAVQGGGLWVSLHDPDVDPDEAAFLAEFGYRANLVAGATCRQHHRWLIEIFLDSISADPESVEDCTQSLIDAVADAVSAP
jgi:diguanylate cyclase (GGDEF)-like protein